MNKKVIAFKWKEYKIGGSINPPPILYFIHSLFDYFDVVVLGEPVIVTGVIFAYPFPEWPVSVPPDVLVKEVFPA